MSNPNYFKMTTEKKTDQWRNRGTAFGFRKMVTAVKKLDR